MISVVSPIYNEEDNLKSLYERIVITFTKIGKKEFEIILVDNGSTDGSLKIIKQLRKKDQRVKVISLSKNFGHQGGILAGLEYAKGDAVISIDGDLQQPPELIAKMVKLWESGFQVVYTTKNIDNSKKNYRNLMTSWFYKILSRISELNLSHGQSDFRLLDRKIIEVLKQMPERNKFLRGLVEWMGFKQTCLNYSPEDRLHGESKFSLNHYFNFALDGIISFSTLPLRIVLYLGFTVAFFCLIYAIFAFSIGILNLLGFSFNNPPGWATIAVSITFLSSIQLVSIGLIGEYISRNYTQSKLRPEYIIKEMFLE